MPVCVCLFGRVSLPPPPQNARSVCIRDLQNRAFIAHRVGADPGTNFSGAASPWCLVFLLSGPSHRLKTPTQGSRELLVAFGTVLGFVLRASCPCSLLDFSIVLGKMHLPFV